MAIYMVVHENGKTIGKLSHEGLVLDTCEENGYDDSDFYAVVWDPEKKRTSYVGYASTRYYSYGNWASVDFDWNKYGDDYKKFQKIQAYEFEAHRLSTLFKNKEDKGKKVRVIKGRKIAIGTEGTILSVTYTEYSRRDNNHKVIIRTVDDEYKTTYMNNLKVIPPTEEELKRLFIEIVGE